MKVGALVKRVGSIQQIGIIIAFSECPWDTPVVSWSDGSCELIYEPEKIQLVDDVSFRKQKPISRFSLKNKDENFSESKERFIAP